MKWRTLFVKILFGKFFETQFAFFLRDLDFSGVIHLGLPEEFRGGFPRKGSGEGVLYSAEIFVASLEGGFAFFFLKKFPMFEKNDLDLGVSLSIFGASLINLSSSA